MAVTDALVRWAGIAFAILVVGGSAAVLLPAIVKKFRRDPVPAFPPVPLAGPIGSDSAANVMLLAEAITTAVPGTVLAPTDEPHAMSVRGASGDGCEVTLTADSDGKSSDRGAFWMTLSGMGADGHFDLSADWPVSSAFWLAVGYLREGFVARGGQRWVHVQEVDMWHPLSAERPVSAYQPDWVTTLPL